MLDVNTAHKSFESLCVLILIEHQFIKSDYVLRSVRVILPSRYLDGINPMLIPHLLKTGPILNIVMRFGGIYAN